MTKRPFLLFSISILAICLAGVPFGVGVRAADTLPTRLSDQEFWKLVTSFSEEDGSFRSDNLLSNEMQLQYVVPLLTSSVKPGRVYMGVGPEQNFTYIAAFKPAIVFIVDIRRGNLDLQLMYKALFELSADRAEFVGRLFSRKRPDGLTKTSSVAEIFAAYANVEASPAVYDENLKAIRNHLVTTHGFGLSDNDLLGIEYVFDAFYRFGPTIQYSSTGSIGGGFQPTYADLMVAMDGKGQARGYLSSEETFGVMKDIETRNLLVPVVGNFAGPKAIRAVGAYLKEKGALVSTFYLSNVEQYLRQDNIWDSFCANVATLPVDDTSVFIRSGRGRSRFGQSGAGLNSDIGEIAAEVAASCPQTNR